MTKDAKKSESKKHILIIEDDVFLLKVYQISFEKEGLEVWTAVDGKEALSFLQKEPPDLILLDLMLPGISGFDVLSFIKKNEKWKNVPVVILTNLGQAQDIERGKNLGAKEYIIKANVRINDVIEKVKSYL